MALKTADSNSNEIEPVLMTAIQICRDRSVNNLLTDPLAFPEFDENVAEHCIAQSRSVELDFVTRPKQLGGTRLEIIPDFLTSVQLQMVTQKLHTLDISLPHSASANLFDINSIKVTSYHLWWEHLSTWIRHVLVEGKTVIIADIESFFPSINRSTIKSCLQQVHLDASIIDKTLQIIDDINRTPDPHGATRSGLPVSRDTLFWLIADLVLGPVDKRLSIEPFISKHIRWVDDFFLAVEPSTVPSAVFTLSSVLQEFGFRLNKQKTHILTSLMDYERYALTHQHRIVTSLMMTAPHGPLSTSQQGAYTRLIEMDRVQSIEHARLWKRIYSLATHLHSSALVSRAMLDLQCFPTAEKHISSYLATLDWPKGTASQAVEQLTQAPTDSQAISLLNGLVRSRVPLDDDAIRGLWDISLSHRKTIHPYAMVLLNACLMSHRTNSREELASRILPKLLDSYSPLARRFAIQLLWLIPGTRPRVRELISRDSSCTVRDLGRLPAVAVPENAINRPRSYTETRSSGKFVSPIEAELQEVFLRPAT